MSGKKDHEAGAVKEGLYAKGTVDEGTEMHNN